MKNVNRAHHWAIVCRRGLLLVLSLGISACTSLQNTAGLFGWSVENQEPRVAFISEFSMAQDETTPLTPSSLPMVSASQVIESYQHLLGRGDPSIRADAMYRLADLHLQLGEFKLTAEADDLQSIDAALIEQDSFAIAIDYYQQLLAEFPRFYAKDQVSYQLARAHALNQSPEKSMQLLEQVARLDPHQPDKLDRDSGENLSLQYLESQFRRGEYYFVKRQFALAEQAYAAVLSFGSDSAFYPKALYKRGWSLFKQHQYEPAQTDFFELYERLLQQPEQDLRTELLSDTLRVISLSFYQREGADSAQAYFNQHPDKPYQFEVYQSLASLYISQQRFKDAADSYQAFVRNNPMDLKAPQASAEVIQVYEQGGFPSLIIPAKQEFIEHYASDSSFWQEKPVLAFQAFWPQLKPHFTDLVTFYHAKAQKSSSQSDYRVAAKWYQKLLASLPEPDLDSHFRFLLAECLQGGGDFPAAIREYETVAYLNPLSDHSKKAGYQALVNLQNIQYPASFTLQQKLLPAIRSGLRYVEAFPEPPPVSILARVSEQQLSIADLEAAIASSRKLLSFTTGVSQEQGLRAKTIVANALFDLKNYAEALTAIEEILQTEGLAKDLKTGFKQRRLQSMFQLAETDKQQQQLESAFLWYGKIIRLDPRNEIAIKAHFEAATLLMRLERWSLASESFEQFRVSYADHPLALKVTEKLAFLYDKQQRWSLAADELKRLAQAETDPDLARQGFWQVANGYLKASQDKANQDKANQDKTSQVDKAIAAFKHYVWSYPQPYLFAQEGRYQLVGLYKTRQDPAKQNFWRLQMVKQQAAMAKTAKLTPDASARSNYLTGMAQFELSEQDFAQFQSIKLKLPLATSLKKKKAAMQKALQGFQAVAQYQISDLTTASTHKVGLIYQTLASDLLNSQRPEGLSDDELEEYGYLLEEQAFPFEEQAIGFYELNTARTREGVFDQSVKLSFEKLKKLNPTRYSKQESVEAFDAISF